MSIADVLRQLEPIPDGSLVPVAHVRELLRAAMPNGPIAKAIDDAPVAESWRQVLWTVPDATRLGVAELSEAIGRPRSWVYRHCSPASGLPQLPHRKLDGSLTFVASEIRDWLRIHETSVVEPTAAVVPITRRRTRR